jgi:hypothetical protein
MKSRFLIVAATLMLAVFAAPGLAFAQGWNGFGGHSDNPNGPTVSPYMNLLQNNNQLNSTPAYQSLVKPLVDQRNAIQRQGSGLQRLQQQVQGGGSGSGTTGGGTGHSTRFMNYSHFYTGIK